MCLLLKDGPMRYADNHSISIFWDEFIMSNRMRSFFPNFMSFNTLFWKTCLKDPHSYKPCYSNCIWVRKHQIINHHDQNWCFHILEGFILYFFIHQKKCTYLIFWNTLYYFFPLLPFNIIIGSAHSVLLDYLVFKQETEKLKAALERGVLKKIEVTWAAPYCISGI